MQPLKLPLVKEYLMGFQAPPALAESMFNKIHTLKFSNSTKGKISEKVRLEKDEDFSEFTEWVDECIAATAKEFSTDCTFKISQMWASKSKKGQHVDAHLHPNSVFSGIYCLDDCVDRILFLHDAVWFGKTASIRPFKKHNNLVATPYTPTKGALIIFPSNLEHMSEKVTYKDRVTINFNTVPVGDIGNYDGLFGASFD